MAKHIHRNILASLLQADLWEAVKLPGRRQCLAAIYAALAAGASAACITTSGLTALHMAARSNQDKDAVAAAIAALLAEGADVHAR